MQSGLVAADLQQKQKRERFFGPAAPCHARSQVLEAYSDEPICNMVRHAVNPGARFSHKAKVYQTRPCVGFPDPMGIWCIWPRPQAGSVVTKLASKCRHAHLGVGLCEPPLQPYRSGYPRIATVPTDGRGR